MDILKTATDWAKAETLSSGFFVLCGILFVVASWGFWQMGKTDMARAYVIPTLVAGVLLLILGAGLVYGTQKSLAGFALAYADDAQGFVTAEIIRVDRTMAQYNTAVFKVMPLMVLMCSVLIIVLQNPAWRAGLITAIAFLIVVMLVDSTANARLETYKARLLSSQST